MNSAAACGTRTLVKSAHACKDITIVPLKLIALDASTLAMRGELGIVGTDFGAGRAQLHLGETQIDATVSAQGHVSEVTGAGVDVTLVHAN